jgi:general secretion pathway protein G
MRRAFTLIELLVVIAILSLLAAILFPVFARAKAAAKQSVCISNLRQIGDSLMLYMSDNDDIFPSAIDPSDRYDPNMWAAFPQYAALLPTMPLLSDVLQPYLKSHDVFHCPMDSGMQVLDDHFPDHLIAAPSLYAEYGTSYFFRTEIAFRQLSQTSFRLPAGVNILMDGAGAWHGSSRALTTSDDFQTYLSLIPGYRYSCLFGDMHVRSLTYDQMSAAWAVSLQ